MNATNVLNKLQPFFLYKIRKDRTTYPFLHLFYFLSNMLFLKVPLELSRELLLNASRQGVGNNVNVFLHVIPCRGFRCIVFPTTASI